MDAARQEKEYDILKQLNDLGITNIPTLVEHADVMIDGHMDSTSHIREALGKEGAEEAARLAKEGLSSKGKKDETDYESVAFTIAKALESMKNKPHYIRTRHRMLTKPFGSNFCEFRCLEELLLAIKDIISGQFIRTCLPCFLSMLTRLHSDSSTT